MVEWNEEEYEHQLDLEKKRMWASVQHSILEKRVSKLEELYEEELMHRDEEEEAIQRANKANEILVKIKTWLKGTIDAGAYGGDKEETDRAEGAMDLCRDLLEEIEEWENE